MEDSGLPSDNETTSSSVFSLLELIDDFMDDFFLDEQEVLRFNINFLESNGFEYQSVIDYMKLNRFISTAYRTLQITDPRVDNNLISKFYHDLTFLNKFYKAFHDKTKDLTGIFKHQFLVSIGGVEKIVKSMAIKQEKPTEEDYEEVYDYIEENFMREFQERVQEYDEDLRLIINTKTYYFDEVLWEEARKSELVQKYFERTDNKYYSGKEKLSTKMFIRQYLQTIDIEQLKNKDWHLYLQRAIELMG